ncbi:MAG: thioredoxin TrxC [bacterium]
MEDLQTVLLRCPSCKAVNRVPHLRLEDHPRCGKCKTPLDFPRVPVQGTASNFQREVSEWPGIALVDFWAVWCGPCRMVGPILENLAHEWAGHLKVVKVNTDEERELSARFNIRSIPTLMLYNNGKKIDERAGALPKEQIEEWMRSSV